MSNPLIEDIKRSFKSGSALMKIIYINVGVFLFVNIIELLFFLFAEQPISFLRLLGAPASPEELLFKPWTIITYMFYHEGFMHLLFNMVMLYFSGQLFISFLGEKKFISTYILGGIAGYVLFAVSFNLFPAFRYYPAHSYLLGASASIMAVFIGIATYIPNFIVRLFFTIQVPLKWIALGYFILDILNISGKNPGGSLSHVGGALFGYFMIKSYQQGRGFVLDLSWFKNLFKRKMKVVHSTTKKKKSGFNSGNKNTNKPSQEEIDRILDKISKSGYDSLTKKEKETLFKSSNN
ncbi:MAG TPA: rhomboid family intramembrane serine protease [Flavobacteriales bacterium]|nr:rhomboid family intramembrane serine protease [Flavobacteriales bacterium]|tara:strand:+ start:17651 stop:18529 length:879 start_codon:yes stop_codon:yes gene_type:complete